MAIEAFQPAAGIKVPHLLQSGWRHHYPHPLLSLLEVVCVNYGAARDKDTFGYRGSQKVAECDGTTEGNPLVQKFPLQPRTRASNRDEGFRSFIAGSKHNAVRKDNILHRCLMRYVFEASDVAAYFVSRGVLAYQGRETQYIE